MNIPTAFFALVAIIVVGVFVVQPFFSAGRTEGGGRGGRQAATLQRQRATLVADRNRIYAALRDLDFDYKTNKLSDEDYAAERYQLVAQGVEVLQQLDGLPLADKSPEQDPIERAIEALRDGRDVSEPFIDADPAPAGDTDGFCPDCGEPHYAGDRFCGECGAKL